MVKIQRASRKLLFFRLLIYFSKPDSRNISAPIHGTIGECYLIEIKKTNVSITGFKLSNDIKLVNLGNTILYGIFI